MEEGSALSFANRVLAWDGEAWDGRTLDPVYLVGFANAELGRIVRLKRDFHWSRLDTPDFDLGFKFGLGDAGALCLND